jgi:hypothetical protein
MPISLKPNTPRASKRFGLSGKGGVGKTTALFRIAKNPLIFDLENKLPPEEQGKGNVIDLKGRDSFVYVRQELQAILAEPKVTWDWLVMDSASKLEEICEFHAITQDYKGDKSKYSSYQTGPKNELPQYFAEMLDLISRIQDKHNINILIICHTKTKMINNPLGKDYYKVVLDLKEDVASKLIKWFDYLGCAFDDVAIDDTGLRSKGKSESRVISFDNTNPMFDGKSLKILPTRIPFDKEGKWVETVFGKAA